MLTDTEVKPFRQVILDMFESSENPNRYELIDPIMESIDPADYALYLRDALRMIVPTISGDARRASFHKVLRAVESEPVAGPRVQIMLDPITLEEVRTPVRSPKADMIRDEWQRFLGHSLPTGDGQYVKLRDATVADLRYAASERTRKATRLHVEAAKWEWVAGRLADSGKATLGELDQSELLTIQRELEM